MTLETGDLAGDEEDLEEDEAVEGVAHLRALEGLGSRPSVRQRRIAEAAPPFAQPPTARQKLERKRWPCAVKRLPREEAT